MRKLSLILLILTLGTITVQSQQVFLTAGGSLMSMRWNPVNMNHFVSSYNTYYGQSIVEPYKEHDGKVGDMAWKFNLILMDEEESGFVAAMSYSHNRTTQVNHSKLLSGFEQEYELIFKDHDITIDLGYSIGGLVFANFSTAFLFRNNQINYYTIIQDGTRSMGFEYDINGVYKTFTPSVELGTTLGLKLGRFFVPFRITWPISYMEEYQTSLLDFDANRYRQHDFPRDFGLFIQDTMGEQAETNTIYSSDFKGPRFSIGIEFALFKI
jgi:hypothetical protein